MITITININDRPIHVRSAINVTDIYLESDFAEIRKEIENGYSVYRIDNGDLIFHKREDGAIELSKKLLDTIKDLTRKDEEKRMFKFLEMMDELKNEDKDR